MENLGFFPVGTMQMHTLYNVLVKKWCVWAFYLNFWDAPHGAAHDHSIAPFFDRMHI
jgi:hypothetical protein